MIELKGPLKVFASSITATDSETQATQKLYSYLAKYVEFNGKLGEVRLPFAHILTACTPTACCSARCDPPCYDLIRLCVCWSCLVGFQAAAAQDQEAAIKAWKGGCVCPRPSASPACCTSILPARLYCLSRPNLHL